MSEILKDVILEKINISHFMLAMAAIMFLPIVIKVLFFPKQEKYKDNWVLILSSSILMTLLCFLHLFRFYQDVMEEVFVREHGIIQNVKVDVNNRFLDNKPIYKIIVNAKISKGDILLRNKENSIEREYIVDEEKFNNAKENIGKNIMSFFNEN